MNRIGNRDNNRRANAERRSTMFLFTLPTMILYVVFFLVTMAIGLYYSFTDWNGLSKEYSIIGLKNYTSVLTDYRFGKALLFNIKYTAAIVIGITVVALVCALALNNVKRFSTFFRSVYFIPAVISMLTVGLIWNELFLRALPLVGQALGIKALSSSILANMKLAFWGILIVNLWQGCAQPMVLFLAGLQSIPSDLYEAATMDGASRWARFRNVTLPYLLPTLNIVVITQTKAGLTIFDYIKVMTNGGPAQSTEAVGLLIYRHAVAEGKFSRSIAESMVLFVIVAAVAALSLKITNKSQVGE
ncbi:carbohydrate ABC transporter permease [Novisyntrophococcus fermenticellae]|uniref:carbohydrate ABC transporter permease n=1 Tax=Novisyntrophococcus fermenticellae TaxID=2068655 RepID=UPI001E34F7C6|nr:sugar ABC transporter permease [Novisyntrophococcus fermenticellae]